jgi:putative transposase
MKPHETYLSLGVDESCRQNAYRLLFNEVILEEEIEAIRYATNKGLVFGTEAFKKGIESSSGQCARLLKPGPKSSVGE